MEPAGNASPVRPPLPAENHWGNPIRWSCPKIPCHCPLHLRFSKGKTLWIGVYRSPPTSGSHACDSLPVGGRVQGGPRPTAATVCPSAPTHGSGLAHVLRLRFRSTTPVAAPSPPA